MPSKIERTQNTDTIDEVTDSSSQNGVFDTTLNDGNGTTLNKEHEKQESVKEEKNPEEIKEEEIRNIEEQIEEPFVLENPTIISEELQSFDIKIQENVFEKDIQDQDNELSISTEPEDLNFTFDENVIYFRSTYIEGVLQ